MSNTDIIHGFLDNFLWPLAVAFVIGVFLVFRKKISQIFVKKDLLTIINFESDQTYSIRFSSDDKLFSKLLLIKKLIREGKTDRFQIKIKKLFPTRHLNNYEKEQIELHLQSKAKQIKDKLEILLIHPFDLGLENDPNLIYITIENILRTRDANVTGFTKIEMYREQDPKITFPIYLSSAQFYDLSQSQNKTTDEMKSSLLYSLNSLSIFNNTILYEEVIPAFISEIYRIKTRNNFDIRQNKWASLSLYEIGLG